VFIKLTNYTRARGYRVVVQLAGQLIFDNRTLLLYHQDLLETLSKLVRRARFQWPTHTYLVNTKAQLGSNCFGNAHVFQGLHHIKIRLTGCGNT